MVILFLKIKKIKGTRLIDPKEIYEGKYDGFNINFAGQSCLYGQGIYFAKNASYSSTGYAYSKKNKKK